MANYDRIVVVSPRVDVIPNPDPNRFDHAGKTGYVYGIGFIHLFVRSGDSS